MKKTYIIPSLKVVLLQHVMPLAASNQINGNSLILNHNTMGEGNGSDAARGDNSWDIWGTGDDIED